MSYIAITDDFEIRSSLKNNIKKYYAKGFASFKGLDTYKTKLSPKAMKKVQKDLLAREVRVGMQHNNVLGDKIVQNLNVLKEEYAKQGKSTKLIDEAINYAVKKQLPLGKTRKAEVTSDGVMVEVEINPYLRDVNPQYYDAVINMLENKFLDGFSIEFDNSSQHDEYDVNGKRFSVISDLDVYGLEMVGGASNTGSRITEVFCRMTGIEKEDEKMGDGVSKEEHDKIKKQLEEADAKLKLAEEAQKTAEEKAQKASVDAAGTQEALDKKNAEEKTVKEELDEVKEILKELKDEGRVSSAKSVVSQEDKYGDQGNESPNKDLEKVEKLRKDLDDKSMSELMKEIY